MQSVESNDTKADDFEISEQVSWSKSKNGVTDKL